MKTTDKFLIGIVLGIVLLVVVAFAVAFFRPKPAYQSEDTPEAATHNYLLALRQEDFKRAYGYLSPTMEGYPASVETFTKNIRDSSWSFRLNEQEVSLEVLSSRTIGERVIVTVRETRFNQGGLFDSSESIDTFEIQLQRDLTSSSWKIVTAESYWAWCWTTYNSCR